MLEPVDHNGYPVPHRVLDVHQHLFRDQHALPYTDDTYREYFAAELARVDLTPLQALTLCDVVSDYTLDITRGTVTGAAMSARARTDDMIDSWLADPARGLVTAIRVFAAHPHPSERWGVDFSELERVCAAWEPGQALAVLDAVFRSYRVSADVVATLSLVGLLHDRNTL